jgi:hypothetical protein
MKKVNLKGKLTLAKETVSHLNDSEMKNVNGGISFKSCILTVCLNDGNKACAIKLTQQFTCNCV